MDLFIHVGFHKTASTYFQKYCHNNALLLENYGVLYPAHKNRANHNYLIHNYQYNRGPELEYFLREVHSTAENSKCHTVLISGEDFENCIVDLALASEIEEKAYQSGFSKITWVAVERDQKSYVDSLYSELSKHQLSLSYSQLATAAAKHGCFFVSTQRFNNIFVLEPEKYAQTFQENCTGCLLRIPFDAFISSTCGSILLRDMLQPEYVEEYFSQHKQPLAHANARLNKYHVEFNYILNFFSINLKKRTFPWFVLLAIAFPLLQMRLQRKSQCERQFFE